MVMRYLGGGVGHLRGAGCPVADPEHAVQDDALEAEDAEVDEPAEFSDEDLGTVGDVEDDLDERRLELEEDELELDAIGYGSSSDEDVEAIAMIR